MLLAVPMFFKIMLKVYSHLKIMLVLAKLCRSYASTFYFNLVTTPQNHARSAMFGK